MGIHVRISFSSMPVGHRDSAEDRADDAHQPLVVAAEEKVLQVRGAVVALLRGSVDRAAIVPRVTADGGRREHVRFDHGTAEVGHETNRRSDHFIVPARFSPAGNPPRSGPPSGRNSPRR